MKNTGEILQLERAAELLVHAGFCAAELSKDTTALADGHTVADRFKTAVMRLELPYNALMDAAKTVYNAPGVPTATKTPLATPPVALKAPTPAPKPAPAPAVAKKALPLPPPRRKMAGM
jgi:hypothetical protein